MFLSSDEQDRKHLIGIGSGGELVGLLVLRGNNGRLLVVGLLGNGMVVVVDGCGLGEENGIRDGQRKREQTGQGGDA